MNSDSIKQHMTMERDAVDIPNLAVRPIGTPLPQPETVLSLEAQVQWSTEPDQDEYEGN